MQKKPATQSDRPDGISQRARLFDRSFLQPGNTFRTSDRTPYIVAGNGEFRNLARDRRSKKERRRGRQAGRG